MAFATILAVVAGLTLAGASAVSHDLYASVIAKGTVPEDKEVRVSKLAALAIGVLAVYLGYVFEDQNVAFMVGLAFAIAASCNFPALLMSVLWSGTTTRGVFIGGLLGLVSSIAGVVLGPAVWVHDIRVHARPLPLRQSGPILDGDRLRRHLAVLQDGQEQTRGGSTRLASRRNSSDRKPESARPAPSPIDRGVRMPTHARNARKAGQPAPGPSAVRPRGR